MSFYLDTSVLMAALTREERTADVASWLRANEHAGLATSDWVMTEVSAALSIKVHAGSISLAERSLALTDFADMRRSMLPSRSILGVFYRDAARLADRSESGLRSGDALHAAICVHYRDRLCTLDKTMAAAGPQLGVKTLLL